MLTALKVSSLSLRATRIHKHAKKRSRTSYVAGCASVARQAVIQVALRVSVQSSSGQGAWLSPPSWMACWKRPLPFHFQDAKTRLNSACFLCKCQHITHTHIDFRCSTG
ncbi:hypothetical protein LSAT2_025028 [Lamellibrachia satsuma]|nr:hypothetical protein LSAT2_025028 [Lamellibrachia satsuma]